MTAPPLTLGRLFYLSWHAPRGYFERHLREGPLNVWLSERGRAEMEANAWTIPPLPPPMPEAPQITYLTGSKFWYQTAFCAASLARVLGTSPRFELVDDGSLTELQARALEQILPGVIITPTAEIETRLDEALPAAKYPTLRRHRRVYPHIRKLTDVHVGRSGKQLVLDSDMLFFARPDAILRWLNAPKGLLHMIDVGNHYGYSEELLSEISGAAIPARINVGVCGLLSDQLDWDRLEHLTATLLDRAGPHYLLEQALVAAISSSMTRTACPEDNYIVQPSRSECEAPTATLHHYVASAKAWYFRFSWREALLRQQRSLHAD